MGKLHLTINEELDRRFRATAASKFGFKKGNLSRALEEALEMWIANNV